MVAKIGSFVMAWAAKEKDRMARVLVMASKETIEGTKEENLVSLLPEGEHPGEKHPSLHSHFHPTMLTTPHHPCSPRDSSRNYVRVASRCSSPGDGHGGVECLDLEN